MKIIEEKPKLLSLSGNIDLRPLRFLKSIIAISYLAFSFAHFDESVDSPIKYKLPYQRTFFSSIIFVWGTSASYLTSFIIGLESSIYFIKLKLKILNESHNFPYQKYLVQIFIYSSYWLMIFAVSTYLIGFLELVSVKRDLNSLNNETAVYFEAIIMNLISIFLIAVLSFIVIDKSKKISTTPWIALLTCSLFIELSNKASNINQIKDLYSFSAADLYQYHSNQLNFSLLSRSFSLFLGALSSTYLLKDSSSSNLLKHKNNLKQNESEESLSSKTISAKKNSSKNSKMKSSSKFLDYLLSKLIQSIALFFVFYPIDYYLSIIQFESFHKNNLSIFISYTINIFRQISWAYLLISSMIDETNPHFNFLLHNISVNGIWSFISKFIYPAIFIIKYQVFEQIVKLLYHLSLKQFLLFLFCCYLIGLNKSSNHEEDKSNSISFSSSEKKNIPNPPPPACAEI